MVGTEKDQKYLGIYSYLSLFTGTCVYCDLQDVSIIAASTNKVDRVALRAQSVFQQKFDAWTKTLMANPETNQELCAPTFKFKGANPYFSEKGTDVVLDLQSVAGSINSQIAKATNQLISQISNYAGINTSSFMRANVLSILSCCYDDIIPPLLKRS